MVLYFSPPPNLTVPYVFHSHPLSHGTLFLPSPQSDNTLFLSPPPPIGWYFICPLPNRTVPYVFHTHTPVARYLISSPPPIKQYLMPFTHTHPCRTVPYSLPSPVSIAHVYPSTTFHVICIVISTALLIQYLYMNKLLFMFLIYKMMNYNCNIM